LACFRPETQIGRAKAREADWYVWMRSNRERDERGLQPRPVTIDGVGDKYAGAHDAEKCGDCFQHGDDPKSPSGWT
jgi:hypothetical protein